MAIRLTVDENGFVVSMKPIPERTSTPVRNQCTGRKSKKNVSQPRFKTKPSSPKSFIWSNKSVSPTFCPVCGVAVKEQRLQKHISKVHPEKEGIPLSSLKSDSKFTANRSATLSKNKKRKLRRYGSKGQESAANSALSARQPSRTGALQQPDKSEPSVICASCRVRVRESRWKEHVRRAHSDTRGNPMIGSEPQVFCPDCRVDVKERNWKKHLRKVHSVRHDRSNNGAAGISRTQSRRRNSSRANSTVFDTAAKQRGYQQFRELFEETRFGGKYLGQMRREPNGRFGSLPLYDDYGEESGPS